MSTSTENRLGDAIKAGAIAIFGCHPLASIAPLSGTGATSCARGVGASD